MSRMRFLAAGAFIVAAASVPVAGRAVAALPTCSANAPYVRRPLKPGCVA